MAEGVTTVRFGDVLSTSTGNQSFVPTGNTSTPILAVIMVARTTLDADDTGAPDDHGSFSWGITDGTDQWCVSFSDEHNVNPANGISWGKTDKCFLIMDPTTGGVEAEGSIVSLSSANGVTINITTAPPSGYRVTIWWLAGDTIQVALGTDASSSTQNGTQTVTLPTGFPEPSGIIFGGIDVDGFGSVQTDMAHVNIGWASKGTPDEAISQSSIAVKFSSVSSTSALRVSDTYALTLARISSSPISEPVQPQVEVTSVSSGQFVVTTRENGVSVPFAYAAIHGCYCNAGIWQLNSGTGAKGFMLGAAFTQFETRGILLSTTRIDVADVDTDLAGALSKVFGFSAATEAADDASTMSVARENNTTPTDTQTLFDDVILHLPAHDGGIDGHEADWDGASTGTGHQMTVTTGGGATDKPFPQFIVGVATLYPTVLAASVSIGTPTLQAILKPDALAVSISLGAPTLVGILAPDALAVGVALGAPTLVAILVPDTVAVGVSIGSPTLVAVLLPSALAVSTALGTPTLVAIITPDALALAIVFGQPRLERWIPSAGPAGQVVQSGAVAAMVAQSGMQQANVVQSGPVAGQVAQSGAVEGQAVQSGAVAGNVAQSGMVQGEVVQSG